MPTSGEIQQAAFVLGERKKRNNALAAICSGAIPALILAHYLPHHRCG
jgi:hypothetical protein